MRSALSTLWCSALRSPSSCCCCWRLLWRRLGERLRLTPSGRSARTESGAPPRDSSRECARADNSLILDGDFWGRGLHCIAALFEHLGEMRERFVSLRRYRRAAVASDADARIKRQFAEIRDAHLFGGALAGAGRDQVAHILHQPNDGHAHLDEHVDRLAG